MNEYDSFCADLERLAIVEWDPRNGACTWLGNGLRVRREFENYVIRTFVSSQFEEIELPLFINPEEFQKQSEHSRGLAPYLYRAYTASTKRELILRPTSEIPFTELFAKLLQKAAILPFRFIQRISVFRDEDPDSCIPLLRQCEINPFIETYSMLADDQLAEAQIRLEVGLYQDILRTLDIPVVTVVRPKEDTFPEAIYTIAMDSTIGDGKPIQVATVHNLGQNFASARGICIDGQTPCQTSTGISCRALAVALFYGWCRGGKDKSTLLDPSYWPWNIARLRTDTADKWIDARACCANASCRQHMPPSSDIALLGWGYDWPATKCIFCGMDTAPMVTMRNAPS